jgi:type IV pilus assembly protein PilA
VKTCSACGKQSTLDATACMWCHASLGANALAAEPPFTGTPGTNGKAIASLICGLFFFFLPAAIAAVILGRSSRREIRRSRGLQTGDGLATAGSVLGYLGISIIPVMIIAAIAIPNLLRAKMAANEAGAVGSLRSYSYAMCAYAAKCPQIGFPRSLANLGQGRGDCERGQLLDNSLGTATPVKFGYYFRYTPGDPDNLGQITSFRITADPVTPGTTGTRHFYFDQTGVIRVNLSQPADAESPPLN